MAWSPLQSGKLRTLLRIEVEARTSNGQGGYTTAWTLVDQAYAQKIPMRGDEVLRDSVQRSTSVAKFIIRYREDVTPANRIVEDATGKIWNIRAVDDPYGRSDRLELTCESGVPT